MTQFAPKELCEKLQAMGCKSESDFKWVELIRDNRDDSISNTYEVIYKDAWSKYVIDYNDYEDFEKSGFAFVQNDFTGATVLADKNCKIVFLYTTVTLLLSEVPTVRGFNHNDIAYEAWAAHKIAMTCCHKIGETWWQYLERTMRK